MHDASMIRNRIRRFPLGPAAGFWRQPPPGSEPVVWFVAGMTTVILLQVLWRAIGLLGLVKW